MTTTSTTPLRQDALDRLDPDQLDGIARATSDLRDALAAVAAVPGATDHDHTTDRWRA